MPRPTSYNKKDLLSKTKGFTLSENEVAVVLALRLFHVLKKKQQEDNHPDIRPLPEPEFIKVADELLGQIKRLRKQNAKLIAKIAKSQHPRNEN